MAEETFSGPFDFALKINNGTGLSGRCAQGDRCEKVIKKDMFPQDGFVKMYYFAIEIPRAVR